MRFKIISLCLITISSLFLFGCNMEDSNNYNVNTSNNYNSVENSNTDDQINNSNAMILNIQAGKYKVIDFKINILNEGEFNFRQQKVLSCSIVDNTDNNKIKTFFTNDLSGIYLFYLDNDEESYLDNTSNGINIYISKEMAKNILN